MADDYTISLNEEERIAILLALGEAIATSTNLKEDDTLKTFLAVQERMEMLE